jgi:hypothetical protein
VIPFCIFEVNHQTEIALWLDLAEPLPTVFDNFLLSCINTKRKARWWIVGKGITHITLLLQIIHVEIHLHGPTTFSMLFLFNFADAPTHRAHGLFWEEKEGDLVFCLGLMVLELPVEDGGVELLGCV